MIRLSAQRQRLDQIADAHAISLCGARLTVHDVHARGLDSLRRRPMGPKAPSRLVDAEAAERLVGIAHQSPRDFGRARSTWTLPLLAEVAGAHRARGLGRDRPAGDPAQA